MTVSNCRAPAGVSHNRRRSNPYLSCTNSARVMASEIHRSGSASIHTMCLELRGTSICIVSATPPVSDWPKMAISYLSSTLAFGDMQPANNALTSNNGRNELKSFSNLFIIPNATAKHNSSKEQLIHHGPTNKQNPKKTATGHISQTQKEPHIEQSQKVIKGQLNPNNYRSNSRPHGAFFCVVNFSFIHKWFSPNLAA